MVKFDVTNWMSLPEVQQFKFCSSGFYISVNIIIITTTQSLESLPGMLTLFA